MKLDLTRRRFTKSILLSTLSGNALGTTALGCAGKNPAQKSSRSSGIKLAVPLSPDLTFAKQLGVEYVTTWTNGEGASYENMLKLRRQVESQGLKIWNIGKANVHCMAEVTLNLPGRERKIEEYKSYLRDLGKVGGIHYTTYAHMANGVWSTGEETTRGGAKARAFDLAKVKADYLWEGRRHEGPLTHQRRYSVQEIWDNYTYFIKAVAPVAEAEGIKIGIHPDDPPVPELGGVPRCIFSSFDGYKRALEIADSPNIGLCLCVGCWLEGGKLMGRDIIETIYYFGQRGKIFKVHFRNVSAPLPHFVETFMDNGYMDMYLVMKALQEVHFQGAIIADHLPRFDAAPETGLAYSTAYMRALLERAEEEVRNQNLL
jgi:mannonate dehydratase